MNKSNSSEEKELPLYKETEVRVPIHLKITLTIREAAEYSNIGINKIDSMLKQPKAMVEMIKAQADNIPDIDEADYNTGAAVDAADFQSVDGDANLPFN